MELKEKEIIVWLSYIEGITNKDIRNLVDYFHNLEDIWVADEKHISNALNKRRIIMDKIIKNRNEQFITKILKNLDDNNILPLTIFDDKYPSKLKNIYDPPCVIYIKGNKIKFDVPLIAIVGSRKSTPYGRWAAYQFARELTKWDVGIISGLALGIDTYGHKGALESDGYTIGVLGCGLDQCYPASNRNLMDKMVVDGCIISEYCLGMPPLKYNFPARNRIVSGLSDGVIVIEASENSGALITVEYALDQGKDVYALPGNINNMQSKGSNKLIRDGARILLEVDDVIENLKYKYSLGKKSLEESSKIELSKLESLIYEIIKRRPINIDLIINETGIKASELNPILTILEVKGYISQMPGKTFTVSK
ncbi:DNA-processing protein DprA [Alkaliphilus sp. B6464]|uniref:DNA-processing protein DprA n=1 Tax=Alkaliphilus sp. B6464 TaxID=2731219 RepID=UPI001BA6D73E|nr:DNA-processing protein DprA [Alkaliphilus sp. B6464]QUH20848.1 DNA-protecting protein DprA [Alkaliphilus sp. B6464]